jgi:hypothetical protein
LRRQIAREGIMAEEARPCAVAAGEAPVSRPPYGYPDEDLGRALAPDGRRIFVHRDGRPY